MINKLFKHMQTVSMRVNITVTQVKRPPKEKLYGPGQASGQDTGSKRYNRFLTLQTGRTISEAQTGRETLQTGRATSAA